MRITRLSTALAVRREELNRDEWFHWREGAAQMEADFKANVCRKSDAEFGALEGQVSEAYQEEKINLQLKLQLAQNEEDRQRISARITAIEIEVQARK